MEARQLVGDEARPAPQRNAHSPRGVDHDRVVRVGRRRECDAEAQDARVRPRCVDVIGLARGPEQRSLDVERGPDLFVHELLPRSPGALLDHRSQGHVAEVRIEERRARRCVWLLL